MPALLGAWTPQGTFGWFAAWNVFGFVMALLFVPETKALSLEELDQVFGVPTRTHAAYQVKSAVRWVRRCVLRQRVGRMPPLYEHEGAVGEKRYAPGVWVLREWGRAGRGLVWLGGGARAWLSLCDPRDADVKTPTLLHLPSYPLYRTTRCLWILPPLLAL